MHMFRRYVIHSISWPSFAVGFQLFEDTPDRKQLLMV